jgi:hypothetical protein
LNQPLQLELEPRASALASHPVHSLGRDLAELLLLYLDAGLAALPAALLGARSHDVFFHRVILQRSFGRFGGRSLS